MVIKWLKNDSVSIIVEETERGTKWLTLRNSIDGRAKLVTDCPFEIVSEVMAVWGDVPTTPNLPPLPESEPAQPTPQEDADAMLVDHEYRLTLLELGVK